MSSERNPKLVLIAVEDRVSITQKIIIIINGIVKLVAN